MAAYPSIGLQHSIRPLNDIRFNVSDSGVIRGVDLGEATAYEITLTHPLVDSTDRATLQTFYDTYKTSTNTITLAGDGYNVWFKSDYRVDSVSASFFNLTVTLHGVKT